MRFILGFVVILSVLSIDSVAQTPSQDGGASISGRVTVGGKGVEGITVVARTGSSFLANRTVAKTTTDSDGNYRITGLTAGTFMVTPIAKAYVIASRDRFNAPGKDLNLAENEAVKDIDFSLERGGVITGRVTDSEGRPIIAEFVSITSQTSPGPASVEMMLPGTKNLTDDRGVYRIYGLAPGNYKVSVGQVTAGASTSGRGGSGPYIKTFYPGVTDETKATLVEVKEGAEATNIDITPGKAAKGFSASGRVIDGESGEPVAGLFITYRSISTEDDLGGSFSSQQSDANGNFRIEGVMPGRYSASAMSLGSASSSYGEPASFEVVNEDVKGIEIKVRRGSTIEGVVIIENAVDSSAANVLKSISLFAFVNGAKGQSAPSFSRGAVNSDGSFRLTGLSPGKAQITVTGFPTPPNGLALLRTELNGVEQPDGLIEVTAGANVTGVRMVFEYGTAKIRGEVKLEGGSLPQDAALTATILRAGRPERLTRFANVDARGRFFFDDVAPGVYEVTIAVRSSDVMIKPVSRTVTIGGESEVTVSIPLDVTKRGQPQ